MANAELGHDPALGKLVRFLARIPAVQTNATPSLGIGSGLEADGGWWVKLSIDVDHPLAWNVVQELAFVLNGVSLFERPPCVFKPVSPPPYLNGGPRDFLSWVIEGARELSADATADLLEARLPQPVDELDRWPQDDD